MESELDETQTNAQMMLREAQAEIIALKNTAQRIEAEWEVTKLEQAAVAAEKEKERARQKVELRFKTVWMSALRASFVRWKSESRRIKNGRAIEEERKLLISNAAKAEKALEEESARGAAMLEAAREEAKREREAAKLQREETLAAAKKDLNDAEAAKKARANVAEVAKQVAKVLAASPNKECKRPVSEVTDLGVKVGEGQFGGEELDKAGGMPMMWVVYYGFSHAIGKMEMETMSSSRCGAALYPLVSRAWGGVGNWQH